MRPALAPGLQICAAALAAVYCVSAEAGPALGDPYDIRGTYLTGVNLAGAGFGSLKRADGTKARLGEDYVYPATRFVLGYDPSYFLRKGMNSFRLSFLWERLEPELSGPFENAELDQLTQTVTELTGEGAVVILDLHNYARYNGVPLGAGDVTAARLADTWVRLVHYFGGNSRVVFGLMNEPYGISTTLWADAVNEVIGAIRRRAVKNTILVAGNGFSAAEHWSEVENSESNAAALLRVNDPLDRVVFEAHTYFDRSGGGTSSDCVNQAIGVERLEPFTSWLKRNHRIGFVGEFGAGSSEICLEALDAFGRYVLKNRDVYAGWSYWAAGPRWPSNWMYLIEPVSGKDAAQMSALVPYLK